MYLSARVVIASTVGKRRSGGDTGTHLCLKNVKNVSPDQARPIFKFGLGTKSIKSGRQSTETNIQESDNSPLDIVAFCCCFNSTQTFL